jgi:hypothetical protein
MKRHFTTGVPGVSRALQVKVSHQWAIAVHVYPATQLVIAFF